MDRLLLLFLLAQLLKLVGAAILVLLAFCLYKEVQERRRLRAIRPLLRLSLPEIEALYPSEQRFGSGGSVSSTALATGADHQVQDSGHVRGSRWPVPIAEAGADDREAVSVARSPRPALLLPQPFTTEEGVRR